MLLNQKAPLYSCTTAEAIDKKASTLQFEALGDSAKFELICIESLKQKTVRIKQ